MLADLAYADAVEFGFDRNPEFSVKYIASTNLILLDAYQELSRRLEKKGRLTMNNTVTAGWFPPKEPMAGFAP